MNDSVILSACSVQCRNNTLLKIKAIMHLLHYISLMLGDTGCAVSYHLRMVQSSNIMLLQSYLNFTIEKKLGKKLYANKELLE